MKRISLVAAALAATFATSAGPALADDAAPNGASRSKAEESSTEASRTAAGNRAGSQAAKGAAKDAPLIVLMPVIVATPDNLGDGCYAQLYDGQNFTGNRLSVVGPIDMPNMRTAFGTDWSGSFDSMAVGPKATVTVYDNENYQQRVARFKSGQRVADLDEKMGFFEQVRSLKIACTGQKQKTAQHSNR